MLEVLSWCCSLFSTLLMLLVVKATTSLSSMSKGRLDIHQALMVKWALVCFTACPRFAELRAACFSRSLRWGGQAPRLPRASGLGTLTRDEVACSKLGDNGSRIDFSSKSSLCTSVFRLRTQKVSFNLFLNFVLLHTNLFWHMCTHGSGLK